ncbi:hypothetical protein X802_03255 [Thermococcus guaymasensis DSM 11113]|uniref:Uncharacterized protein n=1 Tax=Thermococcus guaymasensis DSM 11113 TaxID=1432656 RepID=A0A0X1KJ55_9EURY|nr:DUF257 family protein [Thermococcus guaymasensis]AJC71293.1 hypothetical protein X802_03255 [Thermococcus guaymasensis DSM 11113]
MEWKKVADIIDSILPGETVLVEYTTSYIPEFLLRFFADYTAEKNIPLIIDDDFDTLYTILTHAKSIDLSIDLNRDNVYVLKTGGKFEVGNVVARIPFNPDSRVYLTNYAEASSRVYKEVQHPAINLVLGLEELFLSVNNSLDAYQMVLRMQKFIGNKKRKAFYLVNKEVMENLPVKVLGELERISTTVIKLTPYHTGAHFKVLKSVNPRLVRREAVIDIGRWD